MKPEYHPTNSDTPCAVCKFRKTSGNPTLLVDWKCIFRHPEGESFQLDAPGLVSIAKGACTHWARKEA